MSPSIRLATVWLGGCSGCHMSFLDLDEWLFDLAARVTVVYSPLADVKVYPEAVDLVLVEGAIANEDHLELIKRVRANSRTLISLGDCAVTGNVTAMRNQLGDTQPLLHQIYVEGADIRGTMPYEPGIVPVLVPQVVPVHAVVEVDGFLPGCPPPAKRIRTMIEQLLEMGETRLVGREMLKFG